MFRRYSRAQARFEQPDPYDGSYNLADPQSLNRYAYVKNDPVNFTDPTGLIIGPCYIIGVGGTIDESWAPCELDAPRGPGRPFINDRPRGGGGGGGDTDPIPPPDVTAGIQKLENEEECASYIDNLLSRVAYETKVSPLDMSLADIYNQAERDFSQQRLRDGRLVSGTARGSILNGTARIGISPIPSWGPDTPSGEIRRAQNEYIEVALHEAIHLASRGGTYSDAALASAAFNLMSKQEQKQRPLPAPGSSSTVFSDYWNSALGKHCRLQGR